MHLLDRVSNQIRRFANRNYILPLLALFFVVLFFMQRGPFGAARIKALSAGFGTLDMRFGYQTSEVASLFGQLGTAGRRDYTHLLLLDFGFMLVYMLLQSLLITALMRKVQLPARFDRLNLLPFLRSALDAAENLLLLSLLAAFPKTSTVVVTIASMLTIVKLAINYGYIALVFAFGAISTRKSILQKINHTKEMRQGI